MNVKDSNRARKRIVAFLLSQGGRVTSGQHDSLVRWIYEKIASGEYAHERVGDLKQTLISMEQDKLVTLEWATQKQIRLCAIALAESASVEVVDEADFDLFNDSHEKLWMLIAILQGRAHKLEQRVQDSEQVLDELMSEERANDVTPIGDQPTPITSCNHEAEMRQLAAASAEREAQAKLVHQGVVKRLKDQHEQKLQAVHARHELYRTDVNLHKSQCGHQITQLERQLARA